MIVFKKFINIKKLLKYLNNFLILPIIFLFKGYNNYKSNTIFLKSLLKNNTNRF